MKHNIFIRSYAGDIEWLKYCLRSVEKFVSGYDELVVVVPDVDVTAFYRANILAKVCREGHSDGYVGQQLTKLQAYKWFDGDCFITYLDSDCVVTKPTHVSELLEGGRPVCLHTPYVELNGATPWQPITERVLGFPVEHEFMRRHPFTYKASHLKEFEKWMKAERSITLANYVKNVRNREFSEFNVIGAWCHKFKHDEYVWLDTTKKELPPEPLKQFWSWGGVEKHREEIEQILTQIAGSKSPPFRAA